MDPFVKHKIKDWFIPHKHNNHHPHVLHEHRLLFHGLSALLMKMIVLVVVSFVPLSAWLSVDVLEQESSKIIELTNQYRSNQGVDQLSYNRKLTEVARLRVEEMFFNQLFAHGGLHNKLEQVSYGYDVAGENLALGLVSADEVIQGWENSLTHNKNLLDSDFEEIGTAMILGTFNDTWHV